MQFNNLITSAILAYTVSAAPHYPRAANSTGTPTTTSTPSNISAAPSSTVIASAFTPSLTQQLFLADTAADRFSLLPANSQFVFDFANPALKNKGGKGGDLLTANRKTFPALVGTGSGMAVGFLGPCGFNTPHVHPRATELQIVVSGRLIVEMLPENGVFNTPGVATSGRRVITNTVNAFGMTPFYMGSVHTQFNPDCTNATFVASFNSEDFGAGQVADELFALSDDVVEAAFGQAIDGTDVQKFRKAIPATIAEGVEQCLKTCGIAY